MCIHQRRRKMSIHGYGGWFRAKSVFIWPSLSSPWWWKGWKSHREPELCRVGAERAGGSEQANQPQPSPSHSPPRFSKKKKVTRKKSKTILTPTPWVTVKSGQEKISSRVTWTPFPNSRPSSLSWCWQRKGHSQGQLGRPESLFILISLHPLNRFHKYGLERLEESIFKYFFLLVSIIQNLGNFI